MVFTAHRAFMGNNSVANLGTGECGVHIRVSMGVRENVHAKCLQVPAARTWGASGLTHWVYQKKEMSAGGGGNCLLSMLPEKLQLCQTSAEIYTTFCLNKENCRKNCGFLLELLSQEGVEMRNSGLLFWSHGKAVHSLAQ